MSETGIPAVAATAGDPAAGATGTAAAAAASPGTAGAAATAPWWDSLGVTDKRGKDYLAGKNFPDANAFASSAAQSDELARARTLNMWDKPDPANPGEWKHHADLGWEPDATKYKIAPPPALVEKGEVNQGLYDAASKVAYENRIPVKAAQAFMDAGMAEIDKQIAAFNSAQAAEGEKLIGELRKEKGTGFDAFQSKAAMTARALGLTTADNNTLEGAFGAAGVLRALDKMSALVSEDKLVTASGGTDATPWAANAEKARLQADPEFRASMGDPRHPLHKANQDKWNALALAAAAPAGGARK